MLKSSYSRLATSLAFVLLAASCAHRVDQRPNKPVGSDLAQTVVVTNETASPLTLLPAIPGSTKPTFIVQPSGQAPLGFTIRLEENVSPGRERQVVLVPEKSSTYVTQSAGDLLIMARFGTGPARQVRVRLGKCLFDSPVAGRSYQLPLKKPPLSGVPSLQLCP
ncbi:MAG: hypothetical protein WAO00_16555 [Chthoniobacterales bacterium]